VSLPASLPHDQGEHCVQSQPGGSSARGFGHSPVADGETTGNELDRRTQTENLLSTARRSKKAVNVSISADLLRDARDSEINLSATLETAVEHELRQLRKRKWLERIENAIQAYNRDVEEQGAFSDGLRTF
jgi:antitoxin CcdA